jgi:hypothetical protein
MSHLFRLSNQRHLAFGAFRFVHPWTAGSSKIKK